MRGEKVEGGRRHERICPSCRLINMSSLNGPRISVDNCRQCLRKEQRKSVQPILLFANMESAVLTTEIPSLGNKRAIYS